MLRIFKFVQKERLYLLLLTFIILLNVILLMPAKPKPKPVEKPKNTYEDMFMKKEAAEELLQKNKVLALVISLVSLLILAFILLGAVVDALLLSIKFSGRRLDIRTYELQKPKWNIWDVCRVVILFLFFGYMIVMIESALARALPVVKDHNFRMIVNSSILDILTVVFILYFTVGQYKERLISLGVSTKNFLKNIYYGIVCYIAVIPVLVILMILTVVVTKLINYVPEQQAVVELFLKEKDVTFLFYTSVFAAIVGPVIEELFFRGFMYTALKKKMGIFWAALFTSSIFAGLHAHAVGFLPIVALGLALVYIYEKTGTLVASMTVHVMHNMSMVFLVFLTKQLRA